MLNAVQHSSSEKPVTTTPLRRLGDFDDQTFDVVATEQQRGHRVGAFPTTPMSSSTRVKLHSAQMEAADDGIVPG
jgi:hypothetical protein